MESQKQKEQTWPQNLEVTNSRSSVKKRHIIHVECPIRDHRGDGKVERLIRTINERLRANKK